MAIENFEGKNIQDTFQRVVQTDSTNRLADGTGSIFIPVSSSHAITASHALFAISASHEITFELSSSHAVSADTASFATNFTASNNISASGIITAARFNGNGQNIVDVSYNNLSFVPSGIISGAAQLPSGIISGAAQINNLDLTINGGTF